MPKVYEKEFDYNADRSAAGTFNSTATPNLSKPTGKNQVSVQYSTPPVQHVPKKITLTKKFSFMITLAGIIELVSGMPVFGFLL